MQAKGVPTVHAQAVMGRESGTITFDAYGSGGPLRYRGDAPWNAWPEALKAAQIPFGAPSPSWCTPQRLSIMTVMGWDCG